MDLNVNCHICVLINDKQIYIYYRCTPIWRERNSASAVSLLTATDWAQHNGYTITVLQTGFLDWNVVPAAQGKPAFSQIPHFHALWFQWAKWGAPGIPLWGSHHGPHRAAPFPVSDTACACMHIRTCLYLVCLKILLKNAKAHTVSLKQMSVALWSSRWEGFVAFFFFSWLLLYINVTYSNNHRKILCPCVWIIKIGTSPD